MYFLMATLETIISHSSIEGRIRQFAQSKIENLSTLIEHLANQSIRILEKIQSLLKEEKHYFYFDGEQFIPNPELIFQNISYFFYLTFLT